MIKLRVKEILKDKGVSQKELAEKLNMTETGLSISINENGNPPLKRLEDIANILEVELVELFTPIDSNTKGYIEHNGTIHKINSIQDLRNLLEDFDGEKRNSDYKI
ncbi:MULTISPECIES: helix-turn-helix domain-containing protein [unclassified Apibacter]|uniref:helix-turn-helix domain-containing protein n=1 Tax=unclassified Apibacter TaxID=2630820 RepID=UPI00132B8713|nr:MULTISPECIES: helix-turn-helix transcriptional regulator [unclassified Apibacter]MCX8676283.1 helix-turn-helix transcriptional regulator [Apibacter sp. B3919]MXO23749.1 helix-turn-helix domain-containing protein [Apibacter sp. B3924]MXO26573.1 helix-turn-helix domain-containing protein [Apibacter sp. B3813]MXO29440.1 helix-turn-helix domain-containing protein [Apibacter sp. B3913]MXO31392.1 helix-turn-helix domain-containing protein [Apibacter sp. B3912]